MDAPRTAANTDMLNKTKTIQNKNSVVQERKFYFQTGISFKALPGHTYKIMFEGYGI